MGVPVHFDDGVCDSLFADFVPDHAFDPSVNLQLQNKLR